VRASTGAYQNNVVDRDLTGGQARGLTPTDIFVRFLGAWRTIAGCEANLYDPQKPDVLECGGVELGFVLHPSHSKVPIIYSERRLDYKVATDPQKTIAKIETLVLHGY
jgi:hypothetical protein